jgi:hypothetical protein
MKVAAWVLAGISGLTPAVIAALQWLNLGSYDALLKAFAASILLALALSPVAIFLAWRARFGFMQISVVSAPLVLAVVAFFALPQVAGTT